MQHEGNHHDHGDHTPNDLELKVTCPHCRKPFALGEAVRENLSRAVRDEIEFEFAQKEEALLNQQEHLLKEQRKLKIDFQRQVAQTKVKLSEEIRDEVEEEYRLREADSAKRITDLKKEITALQRKAEQGSMKDQGTVQETVLAESLARTFPGDHIEAVTSGKRGADIIHTVKNDTGRAVGKILWESKRTKNFQAAWISKLKEDAFAEGADVAVIATRELPKTGFEQGKKNGFGIKDGVWITQLRYAEGLAAALRQQLIALSQARAADGSRNEKMASVYDYLTGNRFANRIQTMVEVFTDMKTELDKERRSFERSFARREKQMQKVVMNVAGLIGDMQGLGAPVKDIPKLEYSQELLPWNL